MVAILQAPHLLLGGGDDEGWEGGGLCTHSQHKNTKGLEVLSLSTQQQGASTREARPNPTVGWSCRLLAPACSRCAAVAGAWSLVAGTRVAVKTCSRKQHVLDTSGMSYIPGQLHARAGIRPATCRAQHDWGLTGDGLGELTGEGGFCWGTGGAGLGSDCG